MTSPRINNRQMEIDKLANQVSCEVEKMLCLDCLQQRLSVNDDWTPIFKTLLEHFSSTARHYVYLANKIMPCVAKYAPELPFEYYYEQVLKQIADHVRLLSQLFVQPSCTPLGSEQVSDFDAIRAIIWDASQYLSGERPVLIPMLSTQFMYVHLNYVSGIGIIGVPPYGLVRPYPDLPILWHEVAAYWVARLRAVQTPEEHLKSQANELKNILLSHKLGDNRTLWGYYRDQYVDTLSQDVRVKLTVNPKSIGIKGQAKLLRYFASDSNDSQEQNVDIDTTWQQVWLGQILEDMFGVQHLGPVMRDSLEFALKKAYETPSDIGDYGHPSPKLRLKIADEYLNGNAAGILETMEENDDEVTRVAKVIASSLLKKYPRQSETALMNTGIAKLVKIVTDNALHSESTQLGIKELIKEPAIRSALTDFRGYLHGVQPSEQIQLSDQIWKQAGFTTDDTSMPISKDPCIDPKMAPKRLEQFRGIVFTDTDESAPKGPPPLLPVP